MTTETSPRSDDSANPQSPASPDAPAPADQAAEDSGTGFPTGFRLVLFAVACAMIGAAIWLLTPAGDGPGVTKMITSSVAPRQDPPRAGSPLPPLELKTLDGRTVNLADMKGKQVIINFWATWCPPCRDELPGLAQTYKEKQGQGLEILAVDVQETEPVVQTYLKEIGGLPFTVVMDKEGELFRTFAVSSLPTTFFVDDEGIVRLTFVGGMNYSTIQRKLQQTLDEQDYARTQKKSG